MKTLLLAITLLLGIFSAYAQTPQAISYQAVARNLEGNVLANQNVSLRISIISGSMSGTAEYVETHDVRTNQFGLINIRIGMGTASEGNFSTIDWGSNPFFSKIEMDINDGSGYQEIGISQMLAVPYALYAAKAHDTDFNFIITGIADVKCNIGESISMPISLHWISGDQTSVTLSATSIPEGVDLTFEKNNEHPNFASKINIEVTRGATKGVHTISITGTAHDGRIRTYSFDLELLSTLSAELTVKDATTWTPENPDLEPAANATIKLYASQASFDNNIPEFTLMTNADGFVKTYDLTTGEYIMLVEKDNLSNIINGYLIKGVYQNQEEINNGPHQTGATVGGLMFTDINQDGIVNSDDKVKGDRITITMDQAVNQTIIIGNKPESTFPWTEQAIIDVLSESRDNMDNFVQTEYLFDGVFTGTGLAPTSPWNNIGQKNLTAFDSRIGSLWNNAYITIDKANRIIANVDAIDMDAQSRDGYIAQAKTMRAFLHFNLANLFGDIPIILQPIDPFDSKPRNTVNEVFAQTETDLLAALSLLSQFPGDNISNLFAKGLLVRLYVQQQKWTDAAVMSSQIINSGQLNLATNNNDAFVSSSPETILGFEKGNLNEFNTFFVKGNYVPILRYTEIILLRAEALLQLDNIAEATTLINQLKVRRNEAPLNGSQSTAELRQELLTNWETELANEGSWFYTLKRFGQAINRLQIQQHNLVLPIPMGALANNPNLLQNPGY